MAVSEKTEKSSINQSAFKVMAGGVFSLAAGLINQVVIAAIFGASAGMDAYNTAVIIPAYFHLVLISGFSFVFIPAFVKEEAVGKEDDAWILVGTFFWITASILLIIAIIMSIFSVQIIDLSAPGFLPQKSAIAAKMLSVMMFSVLFTGLSSFTIGIQNARGRFFWPSFGGAVNSMGNLVFLLLLHRWLGPLALAWAYLVSTILQASVTVIPVLRHGWKKVLPIIDPKVQEMGKLIAPIIISGLLTSFTPVAERYFASGLPDGQISYIGYAYKISGIFVSLLASGVAAAIFPSMARALIQDGLKGLANKNNYGLKLSVAVAMPAVLISTTVAVPIISILFQRGAFLSVDTQGVSKIILAVLLSDVLFRMLSNIFIRSSYVLKDTLTPPIVGSIAAVIYLASGRFFVIHFGYIGLVWARTIQNALSVVMLWFLILKKLQYVDGLKTLLHVLEYSLAAFTVYGTCRFIVSLISSAHLFLQLLVGGLAGVVLYSAYLYVRDREMWESVLEIIGVKSLYGKVIITFSKAHLNGF
jgi:putative peptidoglycan lipid II flippase